MSRYHLRYVLRRGAMCAAAAAAILLLPALSAEAGEVTATDCLHSSAGSHSFGYGASYGGGYATAYGAGSWNHSGSDGCVEIRHELVNPYVIEVAPPRSEAEAREAANHERLWRARCHPVVRQDRYGVNRYVYAAPGCEFGRYE